MCGRVRMGVVVIYLLFVFWGFLDKVQNFQDQDIFFVFVVRLVEFFGECFFGSCFVYVVFLVNFLFKNWLEVWVRVGLDQVESYVVGLG